MKVAPVYPKQDPSYRQRVLDELYRRIRLTNFLEDEKPRRPCRIKGPAGPPPEYYKKFKR